MLKIIRQIACFISYLDSKIANALLSLGGAIQDGINAGMNRAHR
jgi:hypothetical protein